MMYLIIQDFGALGPSVIERDVRHMGWADTVADIASGQVERVRQVIEVDLARGTSRDVTPLVRLNVDNPHQMCLSTCACEGAVLGP